MILGEDCYLYIDLNTPEDQRTVSILCMNCHKDFPKLGQFWEGSKLGYGPYDFICSKCGHIVSTPTNSVMKGLYENNQTNI